MSRAREIFLLVALLILLAGCSPYVAQEQPVSTADATLSARQSVGQTFVARGGGLMGIDVWLSPQLAGSGEVQLHLRTNSQSSADLATARIPVQSITAPSFYRFIFPSQPDSNGRAYYFLLDLQGGGELRVGTAPGDRYLDGAFYRDGEPLDQQTAFQSLYEPVGLSLGVLTQLGLWLSVVAIGIFLYLLPGWALLVLLHPEADALAWPETVGLAGGLSLAFYPLLLLWTDAIGLHGGALYAGVPGLLALGVLIWHYRHRCPRTLSISLTRWLRSTASWPDILLVVVLGLILFVRLWAVRLLDVPMWGDAYQHTVIAQLLVDHDGLFNSWEPYAPYASLTVQFGFPALVSLFSWLTRAPMTQAALLVGQIINALAVLGLYPLAMRLTERNRWAGVGAILIAGLVSPMPAFYVNWGRYAQLAGQAVLPVALVLLWDTVEGKRVGQVALLAGGTLAGMLLAYYRMPFYYGTFVIAWLVGWGLPNWRTDGRRWLRSLSIMALVAFVGGALFLPWVPRLLGGTLASAVETGITQGSALDGVLADYQMWLNLNQFVPRLLQAIALLAFATSLIQKRWAIGSLALWVVGLAAIVAGRLIHLPGANLMQSFAVLIALYIPIGLLGGWLIAQMAKFAEHHAGWIGTIGIGLALLAVAIGGAWSQRSIAQPQNFALVTHPDMSAMEWIRSHTRPDAQFLVEGFRIYNGRSAVGSDAGWWIPLLAGRANTMPPQYALLNERPLDVNYSDGIVDLVARLENTVPSSPQGARVLCDSGITHVYVGQLQGKASAEKIQLFSPQDLTIGPFLDLLYHEDRVYIFALNARACESSP